MISIKMKTDVLYEEFKNIDLNKDDFISRNELFTFLDSKANGQFDRNVAEQLYERMDKDYDGRITIQEFINVFLEAEEILRNKIENCKSELQSSHQTKNDFSIKLNEVSKIERLNENGIMIGSNLVVTVFQAQNIKSYDSNKKAKPYVVLLCGEQKFQSKVSNEFNALWNETFDIEIINGKEILQVNIVDFDEESRDELLGYVNIQLDRLKDQLKHEEWFDLVDSNGQRTKTKILLSLQWIFSKITFFRENLRNIDENIKILQEDLNSYESDLASLYEPFHGLMKLYNFESLKESKYQIVNENKEMNPGNDMIFEKNHKILLILNSLLFLFSVMICWKRSVFLDILINTGLYILFYFKKFDLTNLKFIAFSLTFSCVIELSWLIIYTDGYWNGSTNLNVDFELENSLKRFVTMISYFSFFNKLAMISLLIFISRKDFFNFLKEDFSISKNFIRNSGNFNRVAY